MTKNARSRFAVHYYSRFPKNWVYSLNLEYGENKKYNQLLISPLIN